jgi:hypothetical protein
LFTKYDYDDQIKKNDMGVECSMQGEIRNSYKVLSGKSERKKPLEDRGMDGSIILKYILRK